MVAGAVAVLGTVERRRRRVRGEDVHRLAADPHRDIPVRLAGQPKDLEDLGGVPVGRGGGRRVVGQQRARHVGPAEHLEGPDPVVVDRVARQHDHAELAGELTEPVRVVAAADGAVAVQVEAGGDSGVRGRGERVWVADRARALLGSLQVVAPEQVHRAVVLDVVELVQQHHVRPDPLQHLGDVAGLGVGRGAQVADQLTRGGPVEAGVVGGEAHRRVSAAVAATGRLRRLGQHAGDHRQHRQDHDRHSPAVPRHRLTPWSNRLRRR